MKKWLLFRTTHNHVYYFFQGQHVILVHLPFGINPEPYYWMGIPAGNIPLNEIEELNKLIDLFIGNPFTFKFESRPGITYEAIAAGEFLPAP